MYLSAKNLAALKWSSFKAYVRQILFEGQLKIRLKGIVHFKIHLKHHK